MSDKDPVGDLRDRILADVLRAFTEGGSSPLSSVPTALLAGALEAQRALFGWYQKALEEEGSTHALEEQFRSLARSFLTAYLDFARTQREHRDALMQAQSELLRTYLAMVDELLGRVAGRKA